MMWCGGTASADNCIINIKDEHSEYFMHYAVYTYSCIKKTNS